MQLHPLLRESFETEVENKVEKLYISLEKDLFVHE